uniref:Uncharacterized protein n=1 Tax=Alexandrium monilatum TaxID=311494 RepID=A0A7S4SIB0_9DINO
MQRLAADVLLALALVSGQLGTDAARLLSHHRGGGNPLRKVINMLQSMDKKIREEGKQREELYDKFMCYCKSGTENLAQSITAAEEFIPQVDSSLKEATAMKQQLQEDLKQHKQDRAEAEKAIQEATALQESNAKALAQDVGEMQSNIKALDKAIKAIEKGLGGGAFLQSSTVELLQRLSVSVDMSGSDRDVLSSFLVNRGPGAKDSSEVLGILRQMHDTMTEDLKAFQANGAAAEANHESLVSAKKKELVSSTKAIEDKTRREGALAVKIVTLSNDLKDTSGGLDEDKKFLADLEKSCKAKEADWEVYKKDQTEETVALAETIKILNEDDALELFKKTLPSPAASFIQLDETSEGARRGALAALRSAPRGDPRLGFLELAVRGEKQGFDTLITKIDELSSLLQEEQKDDDQKKAFCYAEIDREEDEVKAAERSASDKATVIEDLKDNLEEVNRGIAALMKSIEELDKQVAEATTTRKAEHAESVEAMASDSTAKSLLEMAKNRLYKYYNKKLYKKKPEEGTFQDKVFKNFGVEGAPPAFAQESRRLGSAPEADLDYVKKTAESGGVLAMLELLRTELVKKIAEQEAEEKNAQSDYEAFIKDSAEKRALDSKAVADKEKNKAEVESGLLEERDSLRSHKSDAAASQGELASLHADCDWLLQNFDLRKQARADEADALQKAKAVLSGADYS